MMGKVAAVVAPLSAKQKDLCGQQARSCREIEQHKCKKNASDSVLLTLFDSIEQCSSSSSSSSSSNNNNSR